jgi:integrase/recombinase XerD
MLYWSERLAEIAVPLLSISSFEWRNASVVVEAARCGGVGSIRGTFVSMDRTAGLLSTFSGRRRMRTHFAPDHRLTIEEALQLFCSRNLGGSPYRPATRHAYSRAIREFLSLNNTCVHADELDLAGVHRYDQELQRRHLRPSSRHVKIAAVKSFFAFLEEQTVLAKGVAQSITVPKQERTEPARPLDVDEAALLMRVVRQAQQPRDIAVMTILLRTGISLGELTQLTLADLDLTPPQTDRTATEQGADATTTAMWGCLRLTSRRAIQSQQIPLDQATWEALNAYLAVRPTSLHPKVFVTASGKPLTPEAALGVIKRYAYVAGMPWVHSRSLRSGFILHQLAAGTPLLELQRHIGRRQIRTTRRYTELLTSPPHKTATHRRRCGVLIVDGGEAARRQLRLLLEDAKHQVFEAPDAVSARDMLRLSRFSLVVLLHLRAPSWDGAEFLTELLRDQALFTDHRIIVLLSEDDVLPNQLMNALVASNIPIIARSLKLHLLLIQIGRAYAELGAHGQGFTEWQQSS